MSSVQVPPNPAHVESKTAKKKKAKATVTAESPAPSDTHPSSATVDAVANGADVPNESPIIRELKKNIRNVKKKLNATQKVDSIIAENPGASLDDLLTSKKINADQKVQAQKKPGLEKQLVQFQEQVAQYLQVDAEYQKRAVEEKTALQATHQEELAKVKEEAINEAAAESSKQAKDNLLILSKFLRAAAAKRQNGDETSAENRAFEGALLLVYGGDSNAVAAIESLISGSGEKVITVDGLPSEFTCMSLLFCLNRTMLTLSKTSKSKSFPMTIPPIQLKKPGRKKSPNPIPLPQLLLPMKLPTKHRTLLAQILPLRTPV